MSKSDDNLKEAIKHSDEATRLLEESTQIHQSAKQGLIDEITAADKAIGLNSQA